MTRHARITRNVYLRPSLRRGITLTLYLLLREELRDGQTARYSVRDLADALGVSAGSVTPALRTLVSENLIERVVTEEGQWITMLPLPGNESDQCVDRSDQSADRSDQYSDRHLYIDLDQKKKEKIGAPDAEKSHKTTTAPDPLRERLEQEPGMAPNVVDRICANPPGSVDDFETDLARARANPKIQNPVYFTVYKWLAGQRVPPASTEEPRYVEPQYQAPHPHVQAHQPRRSSARPNNATGYQPSASTRAWYHAEIERLEAECGIGAVSDVP